MQVLRVKVKIRYEDGSWFSGQVDSRDSVILKTTPKLMRWQGRKVSDLLNWLSMKHGTWKSEFVEQEG